MTTRTTSHLSISRRDRVLLWWHQRDQITLGGMLVLACLMVLLIARQARLEPQATIQPALEPITIIATAQSQPRPTPAALVSQVSARTLGRAVVAYDAPDGRVIGAIDQGHAFRVVARYGSDWIQADVAGSGMVWLRAADVFDLPTDLADLAPTGTPPTVYVASQPVPPPPEALRNSPIVLSADQQAAVDREFGLTDDARAQALAEQQAREAAFHQQAQPLVHVPDSSEMPCHCP